MREVTGASTAAAVHTGRCKALVGIGLCRLAARLGRARGMRLRAVGRISSVRVQYMARCKFMMSCVMKCCLQRVLPPMLAGTNAARMSDNALVYTLAMHLQLCGARVDVLREVSDTRGVCCAAD